MSKYRCFRDRRGKRSDIPFEYIMDNAEFNTMNSNRNSSDNQQQDGRRNRGQAGNYGKVDFRFLVPSRDAGGLN